VGERRRFLAFAYLRDGKTFTEAAAAVRVKLRSLMRGAKPFIAPEHQAAFRQAVLELMRTKYGIDPSLKTVYNTLKRADLVWITGRSIHPKADLEAQEALKKLRK
jgi:hypothetical protein